MLKVEDGRVPVLNLYSYFTDHSLLRIPDWQRDYSWDASDEGHIGDLLGDLKAFVEKPNASEYLMGSVILCEGGGSNSEHLVIDGQQRTLTLSILFMVALKYIRNHNLISTQNSAEMALATALHSCINVGQIGLNFRSRLQMNNPKVDATIRKIFSWSNNDDGDESLALPSDATKSETNLVAAAQFIYKKFSSEEIFPKSDFIKSMDKVVNSVKIVVLTLDDQKEALSVYDRINNRGMVLSSADLIKNIIFMNVTDSEFDTVSDAWLEMAKELNGTGKSRLQDPKFLLRMLAGNETGIKITYDKLVDHWYSKLENSSVHALDFAAELPVKAAALKRLAVEQTMIPAGEVEDWIEPTPVVITQLHIPYELNSVQHYSVLLAGLHFEKPETLLKLGLQVSTRSLLYIFAQERTQSFETMIPIWAKSVMELSKDADPADLESIYVEKAFLPDSPISVLRSALQANMRSWSYQNASDRKRIRALLTLLNLEVSKRWPATELMRTRRKPSEKHGWDVDHIMPKSLVQDKWVHRLGNLTLLSPPDNRWAGTIRPIEKIEQNFYNQSEVALTKACDRLEKLTPLVRSQIEEALDEAGVSINYVVDETWDEKSVDDRTEFLVAWATHVLIQRYE